MEPAQNPFIHVIDPDDISAEERERYFRFWADRTSDERLAELMRRNRLKWGDEAFDRGMDKTRIEVIDISDWRSRDNES